MYNLVGKISVKYKLLSLTLDLDSYLEGILRPGGLV